MKLFTKYNRINLSVMAVVFVLSGIAYYLLISNLFIHELDESLNDYKDKLHVFIKQHNELPRFEFFEDIVVTYEPVNVALKKKFVLVSRFNAEEQKESTYRQLTFTEKIGDTYYAFNIAKPVEGTKTLTKTIAATTLVLLLAIVSGSVVLNRIILKKLWKPFYTTLEELGHFKLSRGYVPVFAPAGIEEFSFLNRTLSGVMREANNDYRILKEFTENAAHELQTPLAIIRSKLDLVIQEEGLTDSQGLALKSAYTSINRLAKLNQSLLLLTKIENRQFAAVQAIDLDAALKEKLVQFEDFWNAKGITVTADLTATALNANTELVDILLNNMLANAALHTQQGGSVMIRLCPGMLRISNTAVSGGLDNTRLFHRFYKKAAHSQSNGLGLSIIKQICDVQGIGITYRFESGFHHFDLQWPV